MSMIDTVRAAMVTAMKEHDKERKESLSMLLSALKNKQIDKREDLTEAEEFEVVKKEIKQTKEQCSKRLAVYSEFAPEEMSEDEIKNTIQAVLNELGIAEPSARDKGKVMKELMPRVKGRADGSLVNRIVGELLK